MRNKSGLTAIHRKTLSLPAKYLLHKNYIIGRILDYGCGYGKDVEELTKRHFDISGFDPNKTKYNKLDHRCKYDTILCSYVFNVIDAKSRKYVLNDINKLLRKHGKAYITVRRDIKKDYISSKGTHQYIVKLKLPIIKETTNYCIYVYDGKKLKPNYLKSKKYLTYF